MGSDKAVDTRPIQELLQSLAGQQDSVAKDHLKNLVQDASQPRHMSGNSCTRLCYFIEQCRKSESPRLRELAYSHETCQQLFNFYVEWNEKNQHRSMRQVLELLSSLISLNPDKEVSNAFKKESLERLFSIISHESAQPLVKPAFKVLECFLAKGTYSSSDLFETYGNVSSDVGSTPVSRWDRLVSDVFEWMPLPETCSAAAKFLVGLFGELKTSPMENSEATDNYSIYWQRWIRQGLDKHPESLENVKNYLFPPLFKLDRVGSLQFLRNISTGSTIDSVKNLDVDNGATLFLSAMEVGKKYGLVDDLDIIPPQKATSKKREFVELPMQAIGNLLTHKNTTVRSLAFSVLVSSLSSTRPFPKESLDIIRQNLYVLHADTDAKFRNDLFANTKHMLERLRGALALLTREASLTVARRQLATDPTSATLSDPLVHNTEQIDKEESDIRQHIQEHEQFLSWYLSFLAQELVPTASYPRHITSLKSLEILLKTGVQQSPDTAVVSTSRGSDTSWPKQVNVFSPSICRLLLDLVLDPFEEVRNSSVSVLNFAPKSCFGPLAITPYGPVPKMLQDLLSEAELISSRTGRADAADGLAHINVLNFKALDYNQQRLDFFRSLLDKLEKDIGTASDNLEQAADKAPLHGQLATIAQLWDLMKVALYEGLVSKDSPAEELRAGTIMAFQDRLVACCINIWKSVKDTLCHDSPEGNGPDGSGDVDVKGILSYSFRACHESSQLIQALLRKVDVELSNGASFLTFDLFKQLGNLTFEQLSSLRHRGAFSTVSSTFSVCCKLTQSKSLQLCGGPGLLQEWHDRAFRCINEQHSTTRRSAGLPGLITGILSAYSNYITLDSVMMELQDIARTPIVSSGKDEEQLPQVHAMNSIKDIFKSATLGRQADMYVTDCFIIATDSLKSDIWAISNCGLILVKSILDCMLGTSDNKAATEAGWDGRSTRISYDRYEGLPEVLLGLLKTDSSNPSQTNIVFPALEFARRVGPPEKGRAEFRLDFFQSVLKHLNCPIWTFRDLAARTASTFLLDDDWKAPIMELLKTQSSNELHGVFLLVKYLMEKRLDLGRPTHRDDLIELVKEMNLRRVPYGARPTDQIVIAAYHEALFPVYDTILRERPGSDGPAFPFFIPEWKQQARDLLNEASSTMTGGNTQNANISIRASLANSVGIHLLHIIRIEKSLCYINDGTISWDDVTDDTAVELLERTFKVFDHFTISKEEAVSLIRFFSDFLKAEARSERVKTVAINCMSHLLELYDSPFYDNEQLEVLLDNLVIHEILHSGPLHTLSNNGDTQLVYKGPGLINALLKIKGQTLRMYVHATKRLHYVPDMQEITNIELEKFGKEVLGALSVDNDYDTRFSGAMAVYNYYDTHADTAFMANSVGESLEALLPLNLAIMEALTDDDPDIRELGALTFGSLTLSPTTVPEASAVAFSHWLLNHYSNSPIFRAEVFRRITNGNDVDGFTGDDVVEVPDTPNDLLLAIVPDDALFAEEEQNLYIDELRQAHLWTGVFKLAEGNDWDEMGIQLMLWATISMRAILEIDANDGPLGWMSKPEVFAICARIVIASKMLAGRYGSMRKIRAMPVLGPVALDLIHTAADLMEFGHLRALHPLLIAELGIMAF